MNKESLNPVWKAFFILVFACYVAIFLVKPELSPSDEYAFLPTLQSGKFFPMYGDEFPYYSSVELGRFGPLGGQEYNIVALFTSDPAGYFLLNAIEFLILTVVLVKILNEYSTKRVLTYGAALLLFVMPGFTNTFFKILYVEKNVLFLLSLFLYSFIAFQKNNKPIWFVTSLVCANLAIYYKEPVFIAVGLFSAGHLLLSWRTAGNRAKLLDGLLVASSLIYVSLYLITVFPNKVHALPGSSGDTFSLLGFLKTIMNYCLFSDPIIMLVAVPLAMWRLHQVFVRRLPAHSVLDPMLGALAGYIAVFFVLNLYSPYYFLPAYIFAFPPIVYFIVNQGITGRFWKTAFAVCGFVLVVNTIPLGIHYLTYNKYLPVNFNNTLDFLISDINRRYSGDRISLFLDGVDRGTGRGVYFIFGEFLKHKGLSIRKFDFKSNVEARETGAFVGRPSPFDRKEDVEAVDPEHTFEYPEFPFSVFQSGPLPRIMKGDYLIVTPHSTRYFGAEYIDELKKDYDLVFHTRSTFAFPRLTLKTLVKYVLVARRGHDGGRPSGVMVNENLMNWPDYYVFIKK